MGVSCWTVRTLLPLLGLLVALRDVCEAVGVGGIGWVLKNIQLDMYKKEPEGNVATEYELKFHQQEMPIYRLEAKKRT